MSSVSSSFAFSMTYNLYQNQNQDQNFGAQPFSAGSPMAGMMKGMCMLFAGMDMIDNGQMDGSIFQMLNGGQPQQAQYPQQGNMPVPYQPQQFQPYQQQGQLPYGQQAQANGMPFGNNPMMAMLMQMMQMLMFGMMDIMDDGQMNGSAQSMLGQMNGCFPGMQPMSFNSPSAMAGLYGNNGNNGTYAYAGAGPNGAYAGAGTGTGNNGLSNTLSTAPTSGATRNPGAGTFGGKNLSQEQVNNARIIAEVGKQKGASKRDIAIAIATAMQESSLKNLNYGDRDSVGLFQQRPSCGWGSVQQCTDPRYAAGKFFDALMKDGNRNNKSLTKAAQDVQRSAYPNAYAKWENMAVDLTNSIC